MPILVALALALAAMLAAIALMPIALVQRYRLGTSRRMARGWMVGLNMWGMFVSTCLFLLSAALTSVWIPDAFTYAAGGVVVGSVLGLAGLALTRWERTADSLYYTPNRWLVLAITLVVTGRLLYGFWRAWHTWQVAGGGGSWLVSAGVAGSLAAGAVVLGYYLTYWAGVRNRLPIRGTATLLLQEVWLSPLFSSLLLLGHGPRRTRVLHGKTRDPAGQVPVPQVPPDQRLHHPLGQAVQEGPTPAGGN